MAGIRQCLGTFARHRDASLIVSCVSGRRHERLKFNGPGASSKTFAILVEAPPSPGLLPPRPANYPPGGFSQRGIRASYSGVVRMNDAVSSPPAREDILEITSHD